MFRRNRKLLRFYFAVFQSVDRDCLPKHLVFPHVIREFPDRHPLAHDTLFRVCLGNLFALHWNVNTAKRPSRYVWIGFEPLFCRSLCGEFDKTVPVLEPGIVILTFKGESAFRPFTLVGRKVPLGKDSLQLPFRRTKQAACCQNGAAADHRVVVGLPVDFNIAALDIGQHHAQSGIVLLAAFRDCHMRCSQIIPNRQVFPWRAKEPSILVAGEEKRPNLSVQPGWIVKNLDRMRPFLRSWHGGENSTRQLTRILLGELFATSQRLFPFDFPDRLFRRPSLANPPPRPNCEFLL